MNPISAQPIRPLARGSLRVQSDGRLVKLFRRGVEPAFDELVRRHRDALVRYAGAIAGRDRAEDIVQESLVKAHRSLNGDQLVDPKPWFYKIVRNTALNDIRDNRKHRHDDLGDTAGGGQAPHDIVEQRERLASVVAAVSDLPTSQRRALIGHELGGFTHEEIAAELDLTTGATKQLIYRARLTLRNATGALIPMPLIAWLASDATGIFAASATKIAVVAVVAGSSFTAGVAIEKKHTREPVVTTQAAEPKAITGSPGESSGELPPVAATSALIADDRNASDRSKRGSKNSRGAESQDDEPGRARPSGSHHGSSPGDDDLGRDHQEDDSDDDEDHPRPAGIGGDGDRNDDDAFEDDQPQPHYGGGGPGDDDYSNDDSSGPGPSGGDDGGGSDDPPPAPQPKPVPAPSPKPVPNDDD